MILNFLHISQKLFSFCRIKSSAILFCSQSVHKCSEMFMMNLHIIGNTFVNIRINSLTLHFHDVICFRLLATAEFISIINNRKIFSKLKVGPGLNALLQSCLKIFWVTHLYFFKLLGLLTKLCLVITMRKRYKGTWHHGHKTKFEIFVRKEIKDIIIT